MGIPLTSFISQRYLSEFIWKELPKPGIKDNTTEIDQKSFIFNLSWGSDYTGLKLYDHFLNIDVSMCVGMLVLKF